MVAWNADYSNEPDLRWALLDAGVQALFVRAVNERALVGAAFNTQRSSAIVAAMASDVFAASATMTTGANTGGDTDAMDGSYDQWSDAGGTIDGYFEFAFPVSLRTGGMGLQRVAWNGQLTGFGTIYAYAYNWTSAQWEHLKAVSTFNNLVDAAITQAPPPRGTSGAVLYGYWNLKAQYADPAGTVRIRFAGTVSAGSKFRTERILLGTSVGLAAAWAKPALNTVPYTLSTLTAGIWAQMQTLVIMLSASYLDRGSPTIGVNSFTTLDPTKFIAGVDPISLTSFADGNGFYNLAGIVNWPALNGMNGGLGGGGLGGGGLGGGGLGLGGGGLGSVPLEKPYQFRRKRPREIYRLDYPGIEGQRARFVTFLGITSTIGKKDRDGYAVSDAVANSSAWTQGWPESVIKIFPSSPSGFADAGGNYTTATEINPATGQSYSDPVVTTPSDERQYRGLIFEFAGGEWVVSDDQHTGPDVIETWGLIQSGDYMGLWILEDIRDAVNLKTLTVAEGGLAQGVQTSYSYSVAGGSDSVVLTPTTRTIVDIDAAGNTIVNAIVPGYYSPSAFPSAGYAVTPHVKSLGVHGVPTYDYLLYSFSSKGRPVVGSLPGDAGWTLDITMLLSAPHSTSLSPLVPVSVAVDEPTGNPSPPYTTPLTYTLPYTFDEFGQSIQLDGLYHKIAGTTLVCTAGAHGTSMGDFVTGLGPGDGTAIHTWTDIWIGNDAPLPLPSLPADDATGLAGYARGYVTSAATGFSVKALVDYANAFENTALT